MKEYMRFFGYNGGYIFMLFVVLVMILWISSKTLGDLYLLHWCENWGDEKKYMDLGIYSGLGIL